MTPRQIGAVVIVVIALIVILQNFERVDISILFFHFGMPKAILCVGMFLLGVASTGLWVRRITKP
jgi:uncharacterized integral membrane protein